MEPLGHKDPQSVQELTHAVQTREELLTTFLRYVPAAVAMLDREMHYLQASDRWCADHGLDSAHILGRSHYELFPEIPKRWKEIHSRCLAGETLRCEDDLFERADGRRVHLRWEIRPWGDREGRPEGILIFSEDIAQRKKLEDALRDERDRLDKILTTIPGAICAFRLRPDGSTSFPYASPGFQKMLPELPDLRYDATPLFAMMHPGDAERVRASIAESARTMTAWRDNFRMLTPNRGAVWFEGHSLPEREPDGSVYWYGFVMDITERKRAEQDLREKEHLLSQSQRIAHVGSWSVDLTTRSIFWTDETYSIHGVSRDTFTPSFGSLMGLIHPDDRRRAQEWMATAAAGRSPGTLEFRAVRPDGSLRVISSQAEIISGIDAQTSLVVGTAQDITERKRMEETLRERDAIITSLFDTASQGIVGVGADGTIQLVNQMAEKMYGYKKDELLGQPLEMLVPENSRACHREHRRVFFENAQSRPAGIGLDLAGRRKDGTTFPVEISLSVIETATGKLAVAFVSDITERRRLDNAVRQRKQELKTLLDNDPDAIVRFDREMRYQYVNSVVEKVSGLARETFIGKTPREAGMPETLVDLWTKTIRGVFQTGQPAAIEFAYPAPGGVTEWEARDIPEFASDGSVQSVLCIMRDITERKRLEALSETQRKEMHALAARLLTAQEEERRRMSRELHDQICQQLASMAFDIGGLVADPPYPEDAQRRLKALQARVIKASEETRHIAYQLHPSVLDDLGLGASLRSLCKEFSARAANVELKFTGDVLPSSVPREVASCVYRVAQESLHNIVKHANARHVSVACALQNGAVVLTVTDDGVGFDLEASWGREGLGLISMEERARLVNGKLSIASQPGHGTRIAVEVPLGAGSL